MKKVVLLSMVASLFISSIANAAYTEIDCSTDTVFTENSCNKCFDGGEQTQNANLGFLTDVWKNNETTDQMLIEAEQEDPTMKALNGAVWTQTPEAKGFWELTDPMKTIYDSKEEAYILKAAKSIDWIQSKLGYAYNLTSNPAEKGSNIGVLVYPIVFHNVSASGSVDDATTHKECVLFKSAGASTTPAPVETTTESQPVKKLPQTGPEHVLLLLLAMVLGFGLLKITQKS